MSKRQRLSGCEYKKRRQEKEEALQKQKGSFLKYINPRAKESESDAGDPPQLPGCSHTATVATTSSSLSPPHQVVNEEDIPDTGPSFMITDDNETPQVEAPLSPQEPQEVAVPVADTNPQHPDPPLDDLPPPLAAPSPPPGSISAQEQEETDSDSLSSAGEKEPPEVELVTDTEDLNDPGKWPSTITQGVRDILMQRGPHQVKGINFPKTKGSRKDDYQRGFSETHYSRKLINGEKLERPWLVYSISKDVVFCFCYKLFCVGERKSALAREEGIRDWKNLSNTLTSHEKSPAHIDSFQKWKELDKRLASQNTIDAQHQRQLAAETLHWHNVLFRLVTLIRAMAMQNLAFRGGSDKLFEPNNGNFLKLVEAISLFDSVVAAHIKRITSKETHVHYLGKDTQNEIIGMLSCQIQKKIISMLTKAKYYSMILDCTPDVSKTEQLTVIVRFVTTTEQGDVQIREHFLEFTEVNTCTGAGLTDVLINKLKELDIDFMDMRGQGYDNGSNMRGKHSGVQKRVQDINPRAFYVPCCAHTLNLVVNDAASCCVPAVDFFSIVQEVYNFFSASTSRWDKLKEHIGSGLTVKPLSTTRWESRIEALKPIRHQLGDIYDALLSIAQDEKLTGTCGAKARSEASGIAAKIKTYPFMCSIVLWYDILTEVNITSKKLQATNLDVAGAMTQLNATKGFLQEYRKDSKFEKVLSDAKILATELETEPCFPDVVAVRPRKKKRMFDYEGEDEPVIDPQTRFKVSFYNSVLDCAINSVEERFSLLQKHGVVFGLLYNIASIKERDTGEVLQECMALEKALTYKESESKISKDIDGQDLFTELTGLSRRVPTGTTPLDALKYICDGMTSSFPNAFVALRVLLTLPVSVATGERSFSKLKIIKNYLRSTMTQERLNGLATISIEHELAAEIDVEDAIRTFASMKARRVHF